MRDATFIAGVVCFTALGVGTAVYTQRYPSVQPFTAERVDTVVIESLKDKDRTVKQLSVTRTIAVRSDGSISKTMWDSTTGAPAKVQVIDDASSGEHTITDERTRTKTTWYLSKEGMHKNIAHPASTCKGAPAGRIFGFDVYLEESDRQVGPMNSHIKSWAAPKLNCFPLRQEIRNKTPGGEAFETWLVTSVTLGEPPQALFAVDPNYLETPPSGHEKELQRLFPDKFSGPPENIDIDGAYWASRQKKLE